MENVVYLRKNKPTVYILKKLLFHTAVKGVSKTPNKSFSFPAWSPSLAHCGPRNTSRVPLRSRPSGTPPWPPVWSQRSPPVPCGPPSGVPKTVPRGVEGPPAEGTVERRQKTKVIKGLIRPPTQGQLHRKPEDGVLGHAGTFWKSLQCSGLNAVKGG